MPVLRLRNWGCFAEALLFLLLVKLGLRLGRFGRICDYMRKKKAIASQQRLAPGEPDTIERVSRAVMAATRMHPWRSTCLHRSLVLWYLLIRRGIVTDLCIGTQLDDGTLRAHAWLESQGIVLQDLPQVRETYALIMRI